MFTLNNFFLAKPIIAQTKNWKNINSKCVSSLDPSVPTITGFECLFYNILQIITTVAGLAFFAMFIVGGFKYLTSGGDPKKASSASSTLGMSIIGLIGVIISWLILSFIQNILLEGTGVDITKFEIGS